VAAKVISRSEDFRTGKDTNTLFFTGQDGRKRQT